MKTIKSSFNFLNKYSKKRQNKTYNVENSNQKYKKKLIISRLYVYLFSGSVWLILDFFALFNCTPYGYTQSNFSKT